MEIRPQPGPQEQFLSSDADIAIYGGAAGGGKTYALLMEPLRNIENSDFGAVLFRRETTQIANEGGLWDTSGTLYPHLGASSILQPYRWTFPKGATVTMTHLQHEKDVYDWQGAQVPLILFDELTHFTRKQFFYMLTRNRSTCGVRPYIRATCNPDPDSFLVDWVGREKGNGQGLIDWWIGDDGYPIPERSGVLRWFVNVNDTLRWADTREELIGQYGAECEPKSLTFIASSVYDNKILLEADPGYLANLKAQSMEEQMRLLHGNWKFRKEGGLIKRDQILHLGDGKLPRLVRVVVAIDPAVTATATSDECGIIVVGKGDDGRGYVLDDLSGVLTPDQWARRALNAYDHYQADLIVGEVNNGGDLVERNIRFVDSTVNFKAVRASRGKAIRLEPVAALYERHQITHAKYFDKLESQLCSYDPETFDKSPDRMDAAVWALTELMLGDSRGSTIKLRGT
ncbi:terminase [Mesorhizobium sp. M2D.F.Ca.ET.223.01.1.1]|uniref:terminase large subunit domain-containing protein n=1 Tax=unclassified Mesorhizobium TaxID=325217 RepID=UPI000FC9AC5B|nr:MULTISPECIES: terminase family protein [unclassified Mesorhizobium]TGP89342.1 terminase [bacterium M00.F.Ca.ET.221.01.1.1]TGP94715.1 terminase [bacterium M00.F.Ca.ET.222.01.1.1]RVD58871.1 terminase [Mesorhizobium sp. M2D.F.Ca.ET.140.01.1.1]TGP27900.1 terminase [Mesorhizobium sp. M2D.F.Ca.ET.232.01.1.1]TGP75883.1 terminase [Mesorhizobium sp. M2D.F.Ca.ET.224.01.1.1]